MLFFFEKRTSKKRPKRQNKHTKTNEMSEFIVLYCIVGAMKNKEIYNKTLLILHNSNSQILEYYCETVILKTSFELGFLLLSNVCFWFWFFKILNIFDVSVSFLKLLLLLPSEITNYWESEDRFESVRLIWIQTPISIRIE